MQIVRNTLNRAWIGYAIAPAAIGLATGVLKLFGERINATTAGFVFLLAIVFIATLWRSGPAVVASFIAVLSFNFFFLPPFGTFTIRDPANWIAFVVFMVTALTVGQLSARARQRAEEAEAAKREVERLYFELQDSFERSSQAKALKQSERLKSALLDAVTHDLRTPLTSIKASVTTLLEEFAAHETADEVINLDPAARKEMLVVINEEADRLNRFIDDLMELAQLRSGELQLRKNWGSIEEIIMASLKRAAPLTADHRIEVFLDDELPSIRVDARAVSEVLYNLLDNAAKYSPAGSFIRVAASTNDNGLVTVSVEDSGPGIPENLRERVFERFFRATADNLPPNQPAGTGLGLAIARGITEAHEGRIWIEPRQDASGTRVSFCLPIGDDDRSINGARATSKPVLR